MRVVSVESTERFVGDPDQPLQVVRVRYAGAVAAVRVEGDGLSAVGEPVGAGDGVLEVAVRVRHPIPGERRVARLLADGVATPFDFEVAEPGWTMFMVSHFHYDPVWWNTQAAYTSEWTEDPPGAARQTNGFALVAAHLEMARRDPDYKFVLAEVDYLKPYWDTRPEDRADLRRFVADGRVEIMGGTYNEPNTNLTCPETAIRNFVAGIGFQREVMGADPATAWQLDVFGHDPQFPGMAAAVGLTSSSWARGPHHQWGPMAGDGDVARMQFASEFEWIGPSGVGLLTHYMPAHYSAGWWMDSAATLAEAQAATWELFAGLKKVASTRNVLLPVGTDYTPPNKWVTEIHRDWNARYTWPKFVCALPREFFAAVRAELAGRAVAAAPQTRDMNPIYTGKDVSFIDTKQANRDAEAAVLDGERFATLAHLCTGAIYPEPALAKAWVQLAYGAHHDAITGSESDQVYLDLLTGWRDAWELGRHTRDNALAVLSRALGDPPVMVWNPLAHNRTDIVTVRLSVPAGPGVRVVDDTGAEVAVLVEDGGYSLTWLAVEVPSLGWRAYRVESADPAGAAGREVGREVGRDAGWAGEEPGRDAGWAGREVGREPGRDAGWAGREPGEEPGRDAGWEPADGSEIAVGSYRVRVDPARGGGVVSLRHDGRELIATGRVGNELAVYAEYSAHPQAGEGPWHLLPSGAVTVSSAGTATVRAYRSAVGRRLVVRGEIPGLLRYTQTLTLWDGVDRLECRTVIDEFSGADRLVRLRWPTPIPGAMPVSEVGDAVVGRGFGLLHQPGSDLSVDTAVHPWTLENPAFGWFGLSSMVRISLGRDDIHAVSVAEVVTPGQAVSAELVRDLMIALVRAGVTATCSGADKPRYGHLEIDSNLPDTRISLGGPERNAFTAEVLAAAGPEYRRELDRQLAAGQAARVFVPSALSAAQRWVPDADLRSPDALPVLVIAGRDDDALRAELAAVSAELAEARITVRQQVAVSSVSQRAALGAPFQARTVALFNRGVPSFAVECDGTLHTSLMRSCTGWPSGVWTTHEARRAPDGSNFQLQHWTHAFDYALTAGDGDWRAVGVPQRSAEFSRPLLAVPGSGNQLPSAGSALRVEGTAVALDALKMAGNPTAFGQSRSAMGGLAVLRLVEQHGGSTWVGVSSDLGPVRLLSKRNLLEGVLEPGAVDGLHGYEIATVTAQFDIPPSAESRPHEQLGPDAEAAQPLYARYWLHNRGPAPLGGLPAVAHLHPHQLRTSGNEQTVRLTVAADCTDAALVGRVELVAPPGWSVDPAVLPVELEPGGYREADLSVRMPPGAEPGCYPLRAQLTLTGEVPPAWRQTVEDVCLITVGEPAGEVLRLIDGPADVELCAGETARLSVTVGTDARADLAAEAHLISPWGTWEWMGPPAVGAVLPAGGQVTVEFDVAPPPWVSPGQWWALIRVAAAGHLCYTPAVRVVLR